MSGRMDDAGATDGPSPETRVEMLAEVFGDEYVDLYGSLLEDTWMDLDILGERTQAIFQALPIGETESVADAFLLMMCALNFIALNFFGEVADGDDGPGETGPGGSD